MRLSWKWRAIAIAISTAAGIVYLSLSAFKKDSIQNQVSQAVEQEETARVPASFAEVKTEQLQVAEASGVQEQVKSVTSSLPKPEIIKDFKVLQAKVFRNKQDEKKWKQLISDTKYIQQIGLYLQDLPNLDQQEFKANQNGIIDLLVEALRAGDSAAAEQAILDVIKDAQVEDAKLAQNTRELLAGVKAELLYQSSSIKPQLAAQFDTILPGPVSQKIWKNVQQQQADNLALSEAEIQDRIAKKNQ